MVKQWTKLDQIVFIPGRYEGIDERVLEYVDEEISIGDYVLTGGELEPWSWSMRLPASCLVSWVKTNLHTTNPTAPLVGWSTRTTPYRGVQAEAGTQSPPLRRPCSHQAVAGSAREKAITMKIDASVLRIANFRKLWAGQVASLAATNVLTFAFILAVYEQSKSNAAVAILVGMQSIPPILFSSVAGVIADSYDRRKVLLFAHLTRAASVIIAIVFAQ